MAGTAAADQIACGDTVRQGPRVSAVLRETSEVRQDYAILEIHFSA